MADPRADPRVDPRIPSLRDTGQARLLIVDDEPMMVRAIQRLLVGDYEVTSTTDPRQAVASVLEGARFDVILCDLMMPVLSGMEVYAAIGRIDRAQARRIVFMTGGAFAPRVVAFLASVQNVRIEKPIERASLRLAIEQTRSAAL